MNKKVAHLCATFFIDSSYTVGVFKVWTHSLNLRNFTFKTIQKRTLLETDIKPFHFSHMPLIILATRLKYENALIIHFDNWRHAR